MNASTSPAERSLPGSVASTLGSVITHLGGWNAPTRFFPARVSTPTFPPMAASIIARYVVGTWTRGTPRRNVAATNPARSPVTPPPTAMMQVSRPYPASRRPSVSLDQFFLVFETSPAGNEYSSAFFPLDLHRSKTVLAYKGLTRSSEITAYR